MRGLSFKSRDMIVCLEVLYSKGDSKSLISFICYITARIFHLHIGTILHEATAILMCSLLPKTAGGFFPAKVSTVRSSLTGKVVNSPKRHRIFFLKKMWITMGQRTTYHTDDCCRGPHSPGKVPLSPVDGSSERRMSLSSRPSDLNTRVGQVK